MFSRESPCVLLAVQVRTELAGRTLFGLVNNSGVLSFVSGMPGLVETVGLQSLMAYGALKDYAVWE